ncbi:cell division ATP-binding protein FtsE [Caminibacter pacificus]|uniref:ATP-binding cassette domain-containing protein n=1 Tax=Caminibacter pacificus TaxID=1424653 RepID=A0AAJ4RCN9_9BACT|nr:ATP-binding cassette domain-containing protein [Caminibacter pacificus]NPA87780.1 ATP-binding cassette domain-containing protein [Campylobacterota bacterium]QCI27847.1 ATP-binding cassette domain-containing protein [Caminibacter pacificus]ROR39976.1 cell division transport system ATP-binding protein [Caminibacter pacificus]
MAIIVDANNFSIFYDNTQIIKPSSFKINTGDFVFLTGVSGSGKTSIIKALYGEIRPKGSLRIGEFEMSKISKSQLATLRRHLGVVFQDFRLIPEWTILKNVMLPLLIKGIDKQEAEALALKELKKVKLSHKADKYPAELSGGEQQRAAIARAIIHRPIMILADEPISGLDEYSASLVMDLFKLANDSGITILVASHSMPQDFSREYRQLHIEKGEVYELS